MKPLFSLRSHTFVVLATLMILLASTLCAESTGKRYAVLIGIDDYADSSIVKLATPRNDVADLGSSLNDSGWDKVFMLTDNLDYRNQDFPSRTNIENRISLIAELAKPDDTIFIFFSGHGISSENGSSILPIDASLNRLPETTIAVESLVEPFIRHGLRKVVLAIDACREQVSLTKGISVMGISGASIGNTREGNAALTLFATKSGWFSYEDTNKRNGVFTRFLLSGLSGEADGSGPFGEMDGVITFAEISSWLPDATSSYALDQGIRQQAVSENGSNVAYVLQVPVSQADALRGLDAAVSVKGEEAQASVESGGDIKALISSIKGHVSLAVTNSLKDIDKSIASEKSEKTIKSEKQIKSEKPPKSVKKQSAEIGGFGILQFGLFSPVQLFPKNYVIFGPSVGIIQTSNTQVFGLQWAPITNADFVGGIQTGVICTTEFLKGIQNGGIVNNATTVYGAQFGLINTTEEMHGAQVGLINTAEKIHGAQIGLINTAKDMKGIQIGFINVMGNKGLFGKFMFALNIGF